MSHVGTSHQNPTSSRSSDTPTYSDNMRHWSTTTHPTEVVPASRPDAIQVYDMGSGVGRREMEDQGGRGRRG